MGWRRLLCCCKRVWRHWDLTAGDLTLSYIPTERCCRINLMQSWSRLVCRLEAPLRWILVARAGWATAWWIQLLITTRQTLTTSLTFKMPAQRRVGLWCYHSWTATISLLGLMLWLSLRDSQHKKQNKSNIWNGRNMKTLLSICATAVVVFAIGGASQSAAWHGMTPMVSNRCWSKAAWLLILLRLANSQGNWLKPLVLDRSGKRRRCAPIVVPIRLGRGVNVLS